MVYQPDYKDKSLLTDKKLLTLLKKEKENG